VLVAGGGGGGGGGGDSQPDQAPAPAPAPPAPEKKSAPVAAPVHAPPAISSSSRNLRGLILPRSGGSGGGEDDEGPSQSATFMARFGRTVVPSDGPQLISQRLYPMGDDSEMLVQLFQAGLHTPKAPLTHHKNSTATYTHNTS